MNLHKQSALLHYIAIIRKRLGVEQIQPAARFLRHGQVRNDPEKPSGARRRFLVRWSGKQRFDELTRVWMLPKPAQINPHSPKPGRARRNLLRTLRQAAIRTGRGRLSNPTVLR